MRRIAIINQKGGVGKTTTAVNLGAALAENGRTVLGIDIDPQANLTLHLGFELQSGEPSTYTVLHGDHTIGQAIVPTSHEGLRILPAHIDLSGAELELAGAIGREFLMRDALDRFENDERAAGREPPDYVIFDCPPSLGLLAINALAAASEVVVTVQTQFMALQGMSKLLEVLKLLQQRINPELELVGILPCLYDSRLRLSREVLGEIRRYFDELVFRTPIRTNVKLAEAPGFGQSIFHYAPESNGADDYRALAQAILAQEEGSDDDAPEATESEGEGEGEGEEDVALRDVALEPAPSPQRVEDERERHAESRRKDTGPLPSPLSSTEPPSLASEPRSTPQAVGEGPQPSAGWSSPFGPP